MYQNKKTGIVGIVITIVILILAVVISNIDINKMSYVENILSTVTAPIQNGFTYLKNKISGNKEFFVDVRELRAENEKLKSKNSELEQSLRELEVIKSENAVLKEYTNLKEKYKNYETIPANIIQKDITNYNDVITINVGKNDGIEVNMTVIADKGLVGHIISVTDSTAKVQTITDTASSVIAIMSNSKEPIIVNGTLEKKHNLKAKYIPSNISIIQNDIIETSGIGGIYPKGIPIGTIVETVNTKNVIDRYAYVDSFVDFRKLQTVLVIVNN